MPAKSNMAAPNYNDAKSLIPEFDGNSDNLHRFITICEMFHNEEHTDPQKTLMLQIFKVKLVGRAYDIVRYYTVDTWLELKTALQDKFMTVKSRTQIQSEILSLKQIPKEDIKEYAYRAQKLLALYNDSTSSLTAEQAVKDLLVAENKTMVLKAFEDGIRDDYLRLLTKAKGHTDFTISTKFAIENSENNNFSNLSSCSKCQRKGHTAETCYVSKVKKETPKLICAYCKTPNHHISECRKRLFQQQQTSRSPQYNEMRQYPSQGRPQNYSQQYPQQNRINQYPTNNRSPQFLTPNRSNQFQPRSPPQQPNIRAVTKARQNNNSSQRNENKSENFQRRDELVETQSRLNQMTITADIHSPKK